VFEPRTGGADLSHAGWAAKRLHRDRCRRELFEPGRGATGIAAEAYGSRADIAPQAP